MSNTTAAHNRYNLEGGPAFPGMNAYPDSHNDPTRGMSLRDWFAGQALIGLVANAHPSEDVALRAYFYADAMIGARQNRPKPTGSA